MEELEPIVTDRQASDQLASGGALLVGRGDVQEARRLLDRHASLRTSDEVQHRAGYFMAAANVLRAEGRPEEALALVLEALVPENRLPVRHVFGKRLLVEGVEAALDADNLDAADELLGEWERMRPVDRTPYLEGHRARLTARLATRRGEAEHIEPGFTRAIEIFRVIGMPFYLAVALLEDGEWLVSQGRAGEAEPLIAEARELFERLRAMPWLERADQAAHRPAQLVG